MIKTPRTDALLKIGTNSEQLCEALDRSRQIEIELNVANERIAKQYRLLADASKKFRELADKLRLRAAMSNASIEPEKPAGLLPA